MGRSYTPKYRVECSGDAVFTTSAWQKSYGRATAANLEKYVRSLNESFKPGGVNAHIGAAYPRGIVRSARLVRQADDAVVATYTVPMFAVIT